MYILNDLITSKLISYSLMMVVAVVVGLYQRGHADRYTILAIAL